MYNISELENNDFLNEDNLYGKFYLYDGTLEEMARFDRVPDTMFEIHIEGGEGYIPHMHICKKSGKNVILRIKLLTNEYFREKDDKMNTLNQKERKALNSYLYRKIDKYSNLTQWQFLCMFWNRYNPEHQINPYNNIQPDYKIINEPK